MAEPDEEQTTVYPSTDEPEPILIRMPVDVRNLALSVIAVLAGIAGLQWAEPVLIPIVLAILLSYILNPAVRSLAKRRVPRALGAFIVIAAVCGGLGYGAYALSDEAVAIVDDMPRAAQKLRTRVDAKRSPQDATLLDRVQSAATEIDKTAADATQAAPAQRGVTRVQVVPPPFSASEYLWASGRGIANFLAQFAMVLFLVYFLLVTDDLFKRKIVKIAGPTLTKKKISVQIMDEINQQISNFLRVQVITSVLVAVATSGALWAFGMDNYLIWGLMAGIFNSIPYLGPIIVSGGLAVVAFLQFDDLLMTSYIAGTALAITSLEGWLLTPLLMSRAAQMNPVAIFVGLLFWSWVWGVWGTILAVPMLMAVKAVCDRVEDLQPFGELLGE
jgi:predicted PurR-regulated permease PerM